MGPGCEISILAAIPPASTPRVSRSTDHLSDALMVPQVHEDRLQLASGGIPAVRLRSPAGSSALFLPTLGGNVLSWQVPTAGSGLELLWQDVGRLEQSTAIKQGIPVLFPFVNRLRDAAFEWQGRRYELARNCPQSRHAIHGWVHQQTWRVAQMEARGDHAFVEAEATVEPSRQPWPGALTVRLRATLRDHELLLEFAVTNPSDRPVPFSFGLHPYFRFPPAASQVAVDQPAEKLSVWELREHLPTGGKLPLRGKMLRFAAETKKPLGDERFDDVIHVKQPAARWTLIGPAGRVEMTTAGGFREFVVFTPPHREAICLEPYTAMTDAIHLHNRNLDSGLRILPPAGEWRGHVRLQHQTLD